MEDRVQLVLKHGSKRENPQVRHLGVQWTWTRSGSRLVASVMEIRQDLDWRWSSEMKQPCCNMGQVSDSTEII